MTTQPGEIATSPQTATKGVTISVSPFAAIKTTPGQFPPGNADGAGQRGSEHDRRSECLPPQGEPGSPNLVSNIHINTHTHPNTPVLYNEEDTRKAWENRRKQKGRAYWAIISALTWHWDKAVWWLTLTSAPGQRDIYKSWNALRTRIDRTTVGDLIDWARDTTRKDYSRKESRYVQTFYLNRERSSLLSYQYIAVKTSEGNGVYHMFIFGDMLPPTWLRHWWKIYHNSHRINIQRLKETATDKDRLSRYALTQYAAGQDKFVRMSHSRDLVFPKSRETFMKLIKAYGYDEGLLLWRYCMTVRAIPVIEGEMRHLTGPYVKDDTRYATLPEARQWRLNNV